MWMLIVLSCHGRQLAGEEGGEDIRLIPSVIGGDPSKRTSIVTAKSIPAKEYGIQTGEPVALHENVLGYM